MLIRNIWAVGRNYPAHAQEMKAEVPTKPLIFLKAGSSASVNSNEILLPHWTGEVHHEIELAIKVGTHYQAAEGAIALDLTARELQSAAKQKGEPWTLSKSFTGACAVSSFFPIKEIENTNQFGLSLWINGQLKQQASFAEMIFGVPMLLEYILDHFPVCPGDLILTGTPAGVGPLGDGDLVRAQIPSVLAHEWRVRRQAAPPADKKLPKN